MNMALERNLRAIGQREAESQGRASLQDRIADRITRFTGGMAFVHLHLSGFGFWIAARAGWPPGLPPGIPSLWSWP